MSDRSLSDPERFKRFNPDGHVPVRTHIFISEKNQKCESEQRIKFESSRISRKYGPESDPLHGMNA